LIWEEMEVREKILRLRNMFSICLFFNTYAYKKDVRKHLPHVFQNSTRQPTSRRLVHPCMSKSISHRSYQEKKRKHISSYLKANT